MTLVFYLSYGALWVVVIFQSLVLLGVVRNVFQLQRDGPAAAGGGALRVDRPMPEFSAVDLAGEPILSSAFAGRVTGLLFVGSDCETCALTLHDLDALQTKAEHNLVVVCQGKHDQCAQLVEAYRIAVPVIADESRRISELFGIATVPTAVIVDERGQIASTGNPIGGDQLEQLIANARVDLNGHEIVLQQHGHEPHVRETT
jgi:peroxiredoxin